MILGLLCEAVFIKINIMYVLKTAVRTMRLRRLILCLCIYVRQYFVSIQNNKIFFVKYLKSQEVNCKKSQKILF